jgi:outer membrane lipoprotein carrier protein
MTLSLIVLALSLTATPPSEVRTLVGRVQAFYESTQDFHADFEQRYTYKTFGRTQGSSGTVRYKRPAMMRWEYLEPSKRTFVLAQDVVYAYDPEAQTLTKASLGTSQLSASVTFLWGKGKLLEEFDVAKAPCEACKGTLLVLTPKKSDPRFQQVRLEVDSKSGQVLASTVVDPDGSENVIHFNHLKTNVGLKQEDFKLTPPSGTQVTDLTKSPAAP